MDMHEIKQTTGCPIIRRALVAGGIFCWVLAGCASQPQTPTAAEVSMDAAAVQAQQRPPVPAEVSEALLQSTSPAQTVKKNASTSR